MGGRRHPTDWEAQREQLSAYIDGELSAAEHAELERHIPGCPECQQALGELRQVHDLLAALPTPAAPRSFALPLSTRPPAPRPAPAESRRTAMRRSGAGVIQWAGAIAATIGLVLLLSGVLTGMLASRSSSYEAAGKAAPSTQSGAQSLSPTPAAQQSPGLVGTRGPQNDGGVTSAAATATPGPSDNGGVTPASVPPLSTGAPLLPITGMALLALGAGLYLIGRGRRRREERAEG